MYHEVAVCAYQLEQVFLDSIRKWLLQKKYKNKNDMLLVQSWCNMLTLLQLPTNYYIDCLQVMRLALLAYIDIATWLIQLICAVYREWFNLPSNVQMPSICESDKTVLKLWLIRAMQSR